MNIAMLILAFGLLTYGSIAQDLRNPYVPYLTSIPYPFQFNLGGAPFAFFHDFTNYNVGVPYYEGEYEIGLEHYFWHSDIELNSYNKSYQYEIVSFPFMNDCAFTANGCIQTGSANTHSRELFMPSTSTSVYYTVGGYWDVNNYQYKLYNITPMRPFIDKYSSGYAGGAMANCLVSAAYHGAIVGNRAIIPHSIIRCTINFHCGNDIMATIKFIYDNTRGRMRFYPFYTDNFGSSSNIKLHDVIFVPKLILNSGLDHYYDDSTPTNIVMTSGTINY